MSHRRRQLKRARRNNEFGFRDGPCTIVYRDWNWNKQPQYRSFSCLGCRHLEIDTKYMSLYCAHPAFLAAYKCRQYLGGDNQNVYKAKAHPGFCPALRLRGTTDWPEQPDRAERERGPEYTIPAHRVFAPFDGRVWRTI